MNRCQCESFFGTNGYDYHGAELSETHGFSCFKKSADLGHIDAQYRIGTFLLFERSCQEDARAGARYPRLSADSGNSFAQFVW